MMEPFWIGAATGLTALLGIFLYFCHVRIEEGYAAVMTSFGRAIFADAERGLLQVWGPGFHWKRPWRKSLKFSVMERLVDLSGKEGGRSVMAEDGIILRLDSKLRFTLNQNELFSHLFRLKNPVEHIKGLFTCLMRNEIANFKGRAGEVNSSVSYDRIRRDLNTLNTQIENICRNEISGTFGVQFNAVDVTDILPPDELVDALNAVINAQTEVQSLYSRAEADCRQQVIAAEKGVEIAKAQAEAAETEVLTVGKYLRKLHESDVLDDYLDRRRAEVHFGARSVYLRRNS